MFILLIYILTWQIALILYHMKYDSKWLPIFTKISNTTTNESMSDHMMSRGYQPS